MYQDMELAERLLRESVERFRRLNDPFGLGWALRMHGCALLGVLHTSAAGDAYREALTLFAVAADGSALGLLLGDFAEVARFEGDAHRAVQLRGASSRLRQLTEAGIANVGDVPWLANAPSLDEMIGPAEFEQAWKAGHAMSQSEAIAYALGDDARSGPDPALRVTALGRFAVERSGQPLTHWGGPKAGSRQAQAMFCFLLDRMERGVTKDEFIEVIWPDADLAKGDLSFHRTLGGLRATLEPDTASGLRGAVMFANGRYRLGPGVVGWQDVIEFEARLQHAAQAADEGRLSGPSKRRGRCIEATTSTTARSMATASTSRSVEPASAAGSPTSSSIWGVGTSAAATTRLPRRASGRL